MIFGEADGDVVVKKLVQMPVTGYRSCAGRKTCRNFPIQNTVERVASTGASRAPASASRTSTDASRAARSAKSCEIAYRSSCTVTVSLPQHDLSPPPQLRRAQLQNQTVQSSLARRRAKVHTTPEYRPFG